MTKRICAIFLLAFGVLSGLAQESTAPRVAIPLIASDSHHPAADLTAESLVITDQKIPVTGAAVVRGADFPVELGVLIDTSMSQRSADLGAVLKAAQQFVEASIRGTDDRVFFLNFDFTPHVTEWLNREQLQRLHLNLSVGGGTALYDALAVASERMGPADWQKPARRILVLISDGQDNQSHITRDQAALDALRAGAVIFSMNTDLSGGSYGGLKVMQTLAEVTGGESFNHVSGRNAPTVFATIGEMMDGIVLLKVRAARSFQECYPRRRGEAGCETKT